jgi:hypothetical protein
LELDFLNSPATAVLVSDKGSDATAFTLNETTVRPGQTISATLSRGGGFAAWLTPAE